MAGFVIRSSVRELPILNQNLADMTTPQELSLTLTEQCMATLSCDCTAFYQSVAFLHFWQQTPTSLIIPWVSQFVQPPPVLNPSTEESLKAQMGVAHE